MSRLRRLFLLALPILAVTTEAAELELAIAPRWRQQELAVPSAPVRNEAGQELRVTRLALLVSGVALMRTDGSVVQLDGQYGLIDAERGRLTAAFRSVPEGRYVGLEFQVGLPPAINHGDPARWPAKHPLNPIENALHWSWQGGYVFTAIEGRWRDAGALKAERGFSFHLATDARLMTVRFRADFRIAGDTRIDLALDLSRALGGHKLAADDGSESTHSGEDDALAPQLTKALERGWFWLGCGSKLARDSSRDVASKLAPTATNHTAATPLAFTIPAGFPAPELPEDNPLTVEGVALGRALFSDPRLSRNGMQSCASCHAPARAFSDSVALSRGADGTAGRRNAMPLFNLAWHPSFAWDGSKPRVRDQAMAAWTSAVEMHADPAAVIRALSADAALREKFAAAFGTSEITAGDVTLALEQYLLTLVAADSRFDRALRGAAELTDAEKRGFELFMTEFDPAHGRRGADCFHCHGGPLFSDFAFKDSGLDLEPADPGRATATSRPTDRGKFKTPSLRNVALTAPYGHDGRFTTLEDVVAHYDHDVQRSANLDPNLAKHPAEGLALSAADREALVAFLRALTEESPGEKTTR